MHVLAKIRGYIASQTGHFELEFALQKYQVENKRDHVVFDPGRVCVAEVMAELINHRSCYPTALHTYLEQIILYILKRTYQILGGFQTWLAYSRWG